MATTDCVAANKVLADIVLEQVAFIWCVIVPQLPFYPSTNKKQCNKWPPCFAIFSIPKWSDDCEYWLGHIFWANTPACPVSKSLKLVKPQERATSCTISLCRKTAVAVTVLSVDPFRSHQPAGLQTLVFCGSIWSSLVLHTEFSSPKGVWERLLTAKVWEPMKNNNIALSESKDTPFHDQ